MNEEIRELEQRLAAAKEVEKARLELRRSSVTPWWRHEILPLERTPYRSWDPACRYYELRGICVNKTQCENVGQSITEGGMAYLFNEATGRIVCQAGGGRTYLGFHDNDPDQLRAILALGDFVAEHPEGGDVSSIVKEYERAKRAKGQQIAGIG